MKKLSLKGRKGYRPLTIWSYGAADTIPERYRRLITVVMPLIYTLLFFFGITATIIPVPAFSLLIGNFYGSFWSLLVAISAIISLIGIIFKLKVEIYSAIVLGILMSIYPLYVIMITFNPFDAPNEAMIHGIFPILVSADLTRLAIIFSISITPILPFWRVFDIVMELRKARRRQLYAEGVLGDT